MRKFRFVYFIGICILAFVLLFACSVPENQSETIVNDTSPDVASIAPVATPGSDIKADEPQIEKANMVDERFELLSLVFRLAKREEYNDVDTDYQKKLVSEFGVYEKHPAVKYASGLPLGYDAVLKFSVHILKEENGFAFIEDIDSLVDDGRWTLQFANDFLPLLNDFYAETDFSAFYKAHTSFYEAETQNFIDRTYSAIDLEWFSTYVDTENLRCIYSPSSSRNNYGASVNDTIYYCAVSDEGSAIVHEYCHNFANPIAYKWYEENVEFRKWCDDSIDPVKLPSYSQGKIMAGEYVTRAYNALYNSEHGYALMPLFIVEKQNGFPYIEDVYSMIAPYEKMELSGDKIESILGVRYEMGEEKSISIGNRTLRWRVLTLAEPLSLIYQQTEVGNAFESKTGDVLYVEDTGESNPFLLIDLGETTFQGEGGYRKYSRLPIDQ